MKYGILFQISVVLKGTIKVRNICWVNILARLKEETLNKGNKQSWLHYMKYLFPLKVLYPLQTLRGDTLRIHLNILQKYFTLYATRHNYIL